MLGADWVSEYRRIEVSRCGVSGSVLRYCGVTVLGPDRGIGSRAVLLKTFVTYFELENNRWPCAFIRYMRSLAESEVEFRLPPVVYRPRPWFVQVLRGLLFLLPVYGLLVILAMPMDLSSHGQGPVQKVQSDLATLRGAIDHYRLDCDRYPTNQEGFQVFFVWPPNTPGWHGRCWRKDYGSDPWGNPYCYWLGPKQGYRIESFGADGKPGGEGDDADIMDGVDW